MVGGSFVAALYSPVLLHIPAKIANYLFFAFGSQTHMMWQLIPPPVILQYLSLHRRDSRNSTKLFYAYLFTINQFRYIPMDEYRKELYEIIRELHGAGPEDCLVYGIPIVSTFYVDIFPSYSVCYGLFIFCAVKIRSKLRSFGNTTSCRTEQMQKRFFRTQIAQVLLPMVIISFPTGLMGVAAFLGIDMKNFSFFFVYAFWIWRFAQALLLLGFVFKSATGKS
ncbi:hypothetical protein PENTCL1PPCAC_14942, partial [Pristionchus entomophagus]